LAQTNDLASDSSGNGNVDDAPEALKPGTTSAGYHYTQRIYADSAGVEVLQEWVVEELGHAWSGGSSEGSFTDPMGPNASQILWDFFKAQSR
jgi:poly(3-hydroxybutyrate) depolymerase